MKFFIAYRTIGGFKMTDVVEAADEATAIEKVKNCGIFVIIESVKVA